MSIFKSWASKIDPGVRGSTKGAEETAIEAIRILVPFSSQVSRLLTLADHHALNNCQK
jgi:hypothetical protein